AEPSAATDWLPYWVNPRDLTPILAAELIRAQPGRQLQIMAMLHTVKGNEFVQHVVSELTNPGAVKKEDPILASMLVRRVETGKENLRIEGTPAFKQRIAQELLRIAATHSGKVVIEELLSGPTLSKIVFAPEDGSVDEHGVARVDPGWKLNLVGPGNKPIETPFSVVLLHELVHAVHMQRSFEEVQTNLRTDPLGAPENHNREEENTVGTDPSSRWFPPMQPNGSIAGKLPSAKPIAPNENAYRAEIGAEERFGHGGELGDNGNRGEVFGAYEKLVAFTREPRADAAVTYSSIDRVCDDMLAVRDQYLVTTEQIEQTRNLARAEMPTVLTRTKLIVELEPLAAAGMDQLKPALVETPLLQKRLVAIGTDLALIQTDTYEAWHDLSYRWFETQRIATDLGLTALAAALQPGRDKIKQIVTTFLKT
nr:hypothetical protein [Deltaproteobacteria bacterium]